MSAADNKNENTADRNEKSKELDKEIKDTFPASDPASSTQPGSGITGAEVKPKH